MGTGGDTYTHKIDDPIFLSYAYVYFKSIPAEPSERIKATCARNRAAAQICEVRSFFYLIRKQTIITIRLT